MKIFCEQCKEPIIKSNWDINKFQNLFCTKKWKELFYKKKNKEKRICPECNSTFETTKKNHKKFCNNSCSASYNNKNNIKEKKQEKK